jgi:hypothetical protein
MVVDRIRFAPACPQGVLAFPLAGKFRSMQARCVLIAAARSASRIARELSMESCLVARSATRGDGLSGREL